MKLKSLFTGIAVGTVLGGLSALFLTPTNGREMRKCVVLKCKEAKESFENMTKDAKLLTNQIRQTAQTGTTAAKAISEEVKQSVTEWREDIEPHLRQLQDDIEKLQQLANVRNNN